MTQREINYNLRYDDVRGRAHLSLNQYSVYFKCIRGLAFIMEWHLWVDISNVIPRYSRL